MSNEKYFVNETNYKRDYESIQNNGNNINNKYQAQRDNFPNAPPHTQNELYIPPNYVNMNVNSSMNNPSNILYADNMAMLQNNTCHTNHHPSNNASYSLPTNFSIPSLQVTGRLLQIDNRIQNFSQYICLMWVLFIFSLLGLFSSVFVLNDIDLDMAADYKFAILHDRKTFETINFFVNLLHIGGYFLAIQAFTKHSPDLNAKVESVLVLLAVSNFVYFFFYIFLYQVFFVTWCLDIFFLCNNALLYYQAKELTLIFREKWQVKRFENVNSF